LALAAGNILTVDFGTAAPAASSSFDYAAFKRGFRRAAERRGIDPEHGSTIYQAAIVRADYIKAGHHDRAWNSVEAHAKAHTPDHTFYEWVTEPDVNGVNRLRLAERRYGNWDDGRGGVDQEKVDARKRRGWWQRGHFWIQGPPTLASLSSKRDDIQMHGRVLSPTEFVTILLIRLEATQLEVARQLNQEYASTTELPARRFLRLADAA
jgi:hypothetical protein